MRQEWLIRKAAPLAFRTPNMSFSEQNGRKHIVTPNLPIELRFSIFCKEADRSISLKITANSIHRLATKLVVLTVLSIRSFILKMRGGICSMVATNGPNPNKLYADLRLSTIMMVIRRWN